MPVRVQVTAMFKRQSTDVPFYKVPQEINDQIRAEWVDTGRKSLGTVHVSDDKLSKTIITIFSSKEDFEAYKVDYLGKSTSDARDVYCAEKGISITLLVQGLDDAGNPINSNIQHIV